MHVSKAMVLKGKWRVEAKFALCMSLNNFVTKLRSTLTIYCANYACYRCEGLTNEFVT